MGRETHEEIMSIPTENESDMNGKFLTFIVENQLYAMPIYHVVQLVSIQSINEIPDSADYLKGVITLRGSIIPVIDIRLRLALPPKAYDERTCIIVVSLGEKEAGLIVDGVDAVVSLPEESIFPPPKITETRNQNYLSGIGKLDSKVVLIIDVSKVLSGDV